MNEKNTVFIVAGGKGTRLGTICDHNQKCMLELWGNPILYYPISLLRNAGYTRMVIAVDYLSDQIKDYFKEGKKLGIEITYLEDSFISTYDALYKSLDYMSPHFLYVHANILFERSLLTTLTSIGNQKQKSVITVVQNNNNKLKHAHVSICNGCVDAVNLSGNKNKFPFTFLGVAYYKKEDFILHFNGDSSGMVEKVVQQLKDSDEETLAYIYQGKWRHIETEYDYIHINKEPEWRLI